MKQKHCSGCKTVQPISNYRKNKNRPDCHEQYCKTCAKERDEGRYEKRRQRQIASATEWKKKNPERYRDYLLKKTFGISLEDYNEMLKKQGGVCGICADPPGRVRLAVDHCHTTKDVRGLLCVKCNTAIGMLKHDQKILLAAIKYLSNSTRPQNHSAVS